MFSYIYLMGSLGKLVKRADNTALILRIGICDFAGGETNMEKLRGIK